MRICQVWWNKALVNSAGGLTLGNSSLGKAGFPNIRAHEERRSACLRRPTLAASALALPGRLFVEEVGAKPVRRPARQAPQAVAAGAASFFSSARRCSSRFRSIILAVQIETS